MPKTTLEKKNDLVRLNREYRKLLGYDYFIRTEPSGRTGTKWVFGEGTAYSLDAALMAMREALDTAKLANVR